MQPFIHPWSLNRVQALTGWVIGGNVTSAGGNLTHLNFIKHICSRKADCSIQKQYLKVTTKQKKQSTNQSPLCNLQPACRRRKTRSIWKMLGPFATASRCTPPVLILHCHSPGVATVDTTTKISQCKKIDVHDDNDNDNNDKAWQRGPLWPHRMGPIRLLCVWWAS